MDSELDTRLTNHERVLAGMYQIIQQKEAEKTTGDWRPLTINLPISQPTLEIVGRNRRRFDIQIVNGGTGTLLISNTYFDSAEQEARYNALGNNEAIPIKAILSGSSATLRTTGAIFAAAITSAVTVEIIEDIFDIEGPGLPATEEESHVKEVDAFGSHSLR